MDAIKTKSYVMTFETGKSFIIILPNDWDASIVSRTEDIIDHSHSPEEMFQHLDEAGIFAMDLSDDLEDDKKSDGTLLISAPSVREIYKIFEKYFNVFNLKDYNAIRDIVIYAE